MSLINDFNQLDDKFDGINLTFFTFFMMFQVTEDKKLIWCGYPIINENIDIFVEYINEQLKWLQDGTINVPDYDTGDFTQYKVERQRRITFFVDTLYKLKFSEFLSKNDNVSLMVLKEIREMSKL